MAGFNPAAGKFRLLTPLPRNGYFPPPPEAQEDTSETVHISALALLKMLTHARAGVPLEVMGLLIGRFRDQYTIEVVDVVAMPQHGNAVSVESIDEEYQVEIMNLLKVTGRPEDIVGWYHSHPGYGCWLSETDMHTQKSFQMIQNRSIALVVDPIQSVKGKQIIRGLGKRYYKLNYDFRMGENERLMLMKCQSIPLLTSLRPSSIRELNKSNLEQLEQLCKYTKELLKELEENGVEEKMKGGLEHIGNESALRHLTEISQTLLHRNILQHIGSAANICSFKFDGTSLAHSDYQL